MLAELLQRNGHFLYTLHISRNESHIIRNIVYTKNFYTLMIFLCATFSILISSPRFIKKCLHSAADNETTSMTSTNQKKNQLQFKLQLHCYHQLWIIIIIFSMKKRGNQYDIDKEAEGIFFKCFLELNYSPNWYFIKMRLNESKIYISNSVISLSGELMVFYSLFLVNHWRCCSHHVVIYWCLWYW